MKARKIIKFYIKIYICVLCIKTFINKILLNKRFNSMRGYKRASGSGIFLSHFKHCLYFQIYFDRISIKRVVELKK